MHPNSFLRTFWQLEVRPEIFVAMTFDARYSARYRNVVEPAISGIRVAGIPLAAKRVDESKSGDSILTDIVDGIAHARMVLADISIVGTDAASGIPYRNGNVMYEVGIALACRRPSDVLLVRDDREKLLFDVSTIPHMQLDFSNEPNARDTLQAALIARLREQAFTTDARVQLAATSMTNQEVRMVTELSDVPVGQARGWNITGTVLSVYEMALARLAEKHLIRSAGFLQNGAPAFELTPLGRVVAERVKAGLATVEQRIGDATTSRSDNSNA